MRKFINGKFEGTNLEIMPSPAATALPDGTPIVEFSPAQGYNDTQTLHAEGQIDVHERQVYVIGGDYFGTEEGEEWVAEYAYGPTIAQQWKAEYNARLTGKGWTARYYRNNGGSR